jgi:hypothetical protein
MPAAAEIWFSSPFRFADLPRLQLCDARVLLVLLRVLAADDGYGGLQALTLDET